jgi:hypothetical protein
MQTNDPIVVHELPLIRKIIEDETWLEGERRGCHVRPDDRVVRERVCHVILQIGHQLRESLTASLNLYVEECASRSLLDSSPSGQNAPEGARPSGTGT